MKKDSEENSPLPVGEGLGVRVWNGVVQQIVALDPILLERARELRKNQTKAEEFLWQLLRKRQLAGLKFRRQHPVGKYIADFECHEKKLIIELDGGVHKVSGAYDLERTGFLEKEGYKVVRFLNDEVFKSTEKVLLKIELELRWRGIKVHRRSNTRDPHPNPLPQGEGTSCIHSPL